MTGAGASTTAAADDLDAAEVVSTGANLSSFTKASSKDLFLEFFVERAMPFTGAAALRVVAGSGTEGEGVSDGL